MAGQRAVGGAEGVSSRRDVGSLMGRLSRERGASESSGSPLAFENTDHHTLTFFPPYLTLYVTLLYSLSFFLSFSTQL